MTMSKTMVQSVEDALCPLVQDPLPIAGVCLGTTAAGIKKPDRKDLVVIAIPDGATVSSVFTQNAFQAAPVILAKRHSALQTPRYLLINTGYANAGTGARGLDAAQQCCDALAARVGCSATQVLPFSTGVIGEHLPVERIVDGLSGCVSALTEDGWQDAATGIMTTDTFSKVFSVQVLDQAVTVTGMAKGAGMIKPNMATMLSFVATDLAIAPDLLTRLLAHSVSLSFNRISVDGDTSTNDACVLIAAGTANAPILADESDSRFTLVQQAIDHVMIALAEAIVRDGEGATKFIVVRVNGGRTPEECRDVAYTVAHSPLVKTAFFAEDPNWGRILAAVGRAPIENLDVTGVQIQLDDVLVVSDGAVSENYREEQGAAVMRQPRIVIGIDLQRGEACSEVWTTDLSHDYVRINAEYRS